MRKFVILLALLAIGIGAWAMLGGLDRVTEARVRTALVGAGLSEAMADCMAPRMVERLSISQLRKLERLAPVAGETAVPLSTREALRRLRRVEDREAIEVTARAAGGCALDLMLEGG